jgi:hypothetical protein
MKTLNVGDDNELNLDPIILSADEIICIQKDMSCCKI